LGLKSRANDGLVPETSPFQPDSAGCILNDVAKPSARARRALPNVYRAVLLWFRLQPM
jgi:hypothetical protein